MIGWDRKRPHLRARGTCSRCFGCRHGHNIDPPASGEQANNRHGLHRFTQISPNPKDGSELRKEAGRTDRKARDRRTGFLFMFLSLIFLSAFPPACALRVSRQSRPNAGGRRDLCVAALRRALPAWSEWTYSVTGAALFSPVWGRAGCEDRAGMPATPANPPASAVQSL